MLRYTVFRVSNGSTRASLYLRDLARGSTAFVRPLSIPSGCKHCWRSFASVRAVATNGTQRSSSSRLPPFLYQDLCNESSLSNDHIRILELLPDHFSQPVRCRLKHVALSKAESYQTLSYRWGDSASKRTIECDGFALDIPSNLESALRGIRHRTNSTLIWADAICINQANTTEKEHQVRLMRDIYSTSKRTLIWLGDAIGIKLSIPAKLVISIGLSWMRSRVKLSNDPLIRFLDLEDNKFISLSPLQTQCYLVLMNILSNQWFERAWVVQEAAVSRDLTIIWNGKAVEWAELVEALRFLSNRNFGLAFMPTLQHVTAIEKERKRYQANQGDLLESLQRHQRCLATDLRDKVFAFSGLTKKLPPNFRIDYHASVSEVYQQVAQSILADDKELDILSRPAMRASATLHGLPTWVPQWSISRRVEMCHSWDESALSLAQKVSPSLKDASLPRSFTAGLTERPRFGWTISGSLLTLDGYVFDEIVAVGDVFEGIRMPPPAAGLRAMAKGWLHTIKTFKRTQRILMEWEDMAGARSGSKYVTGEPILDAFWKTVSTGDYPHSELAMTEIDIWEKLNLISSRLQKYQAQFLVLPYAMVLALWNGISKGPLLKFELQSLYTRYRRFAKTKNGYIGLVDYAAEVGDSVALCHGSKVPLIIRRHEKEDCWTLVGDAYIEGIMFGEVFDKELCGKMQIA